MNNIWLVGMYKTKSKMEYIGIFSTEEKAIAVCKDFRYWICKFILDEELPYEPIPSNGYYPIPMTEDDILED